MKSKSWPIGVKLGLGLLLIGLGLFALFFVREVNHVLATPVSAWTQDPIADCVVVLTGGPGRIREGISLLQKDRAKNLIISGVNPSTDLADLLTPIDQALGIKSSQVILEKRSRTTFGNAHQSVPILDALRCRDFILVTSRIHMYRARKTFEAVLPDSTKVIPHAVPSAKNEEDFWGIWTEVLKSLFYSAWAYP